MKKLLLILLFLITLSISTNAQYKINVAGTLGLPTGDIEKIASYALSGDVYIMKPISENFDAGFSVGYTIYFGKDDIFPNLPEGENNSYMPLAGAIRYKLLENFTIGTDLGYALDLNTSSAGSGFYYKPMVGYNVGKSSQLFLSYQGISRSSTNTSYVGLGFMYSI